MVSMFKMTLNHLNGMWFTRDNKCSMWIGDDFHKKIEIICDRNIIVSEDIRFEYLDQQNIYKLSNSVLLYQIFDDNSIRIRVSHNDETIDWDFDRRKRR